MLELKNDIKHYSYALLGTFKSDIMEYEYKIITGTAIEVETKLNELKKEYVILINGMSATNETTTILIQLHKK